MQFLRKNALIVIGLGFVVVAAIMAGRGSISPLWIIVGAAVIALGAAQRQKAGKERGDAH